MSDIPNSPPPQHGDDLVEQAVERAATKVAQAVSQQAAANAPTHPQQMAMGGLTRNESIIVCAVLVVMMLTNLILNIQTKNLLVEHAKEFERLCQTVAEQNPNTDPVSKAKAISECNR